MKKLIFWIFVIPFVVIPFISGVIMLFGGGFSSLSILMTVYHLILILVCRAIYKKWISNKSKVITRVNDVEERMIEGEENLEFNEEGNENTVIINEEIENEKELIDMTFKKDPNKPTF